MSSLEPFPVRPAPAISPRRAYAAQEVVDFLEGAPLVPWELRIVSRRMLFDPRTTADTLLTLAGAFDEAAEHCQAQQQTMAGASVAGLAGVVRAAASSFPDGGSHAPAP